MLSFLDTRRVQGTAKNLLSKKLQRKLQSCRRFTEGEQKLRISLFARISKKHEFNPNRTECHLRFLRTAHDLSKPRKYTRSFIRRIKSINSGSTVRRHMSNWRWMWKLDYFLIFLSIFIFFTIFLCIGISGTSRTSPVNDFKPQHFPSRRTSQATELTQRLEDQLQLLLDRGSGEQRPARRHFEENAAHAPQIDVAGILGGAEQHVGRPIPEGDHLVGISLDGNGFGASQACGKQRGAVFQQFD